MFLIVRRALTSSSATGLFAVIPTSRTEQGLITSEGRGRVIKEAKLFTGKSSQENKILLPSNFVSSVSLW